MTPQQPHPQRCETCEKFPFESQNQCVIIRASREHAAHAWFFTSEMGCASHSSAGSQQRIEQFDEMLKDLAIMADESSIVGRDAIKKTERVYHEGSLFAYERIIGYVQKKKERAIALLRGEQHE